MNNDVNRFKHFPNVIKKLEKLSIIEIMFLQVQVKRDLTIAKLQNEVQTVRKLKLLLLVSKAMIRRKKLNGKYE